jgi:hypothetical protein
MATLASDRADAGERSIFSHVQLVATVARSHCADIGRIKLPGRIACSERDS